MKKRILALVLALALLVLCAGCNQAAPEQAEDIVVYYTNDVHCNIDNHMDEEPGLSYSKVAALKNQTPGALLVDAGDHVQGTAYGSMDKGQTIIEIMNAVGYDAATPGNHEFDYGMNEFMSLVNAAEFPYVSCNFSHANDGVAEDLVLDSYIILEAQGKKLAFIGITTPETLTSTTPTYFQDQTGEYIYEIPGGTDGSALYATVQAAIDEAKEAGADYIIALGHLGLDIASGAWTSKNLIANTTGLDALIDGHSHTTLEMEQVTDKDGEAVVLTQTGSYLDAIGKLTIAPDGTVTTTLLDAEDLAELTPDATVSEMEDKWISTINDSLGQVIGYAEITLDNYDSEGNRLVRMQSTNSGDFCADALYYLFDNMGLEVDGAVMNGGGVRNEAVTGELSYLTCKEIHTFGNVACLLEMSGQQLLDMLEWCSKGINAEGSAENGSFLHVSHMKYTVDLSRDSTVQATDLDEWAGPPTGDYRVSDVQLFNGETGEYEPLDLNKIYRIAGYNYNLRDLGGGMLMLKDAVNVLDYVAEDYLLLAQYIQSFPVDAATGLPTISAGSGYDDVYGSGRITFVGGK